MFISTHVYIVYVVKLNDQIKYVGLTSKTLKTRIIEHKSATKTGSNLVFHKAIRKYGSSLEFLPLFINFSLEEAANKEKELIQLYKTHVSTKGYNLSLGGEANTGLKGPMKAETKLKISLANKGKHSGLVHSNETKKKMSEAQKNKKFKRVAPVKDRFNNIFESVTAAAKFHNLKRLTVSEAVRHNRPTRKGIKFSYIYESRTTLAKI